MTDTIVNDVLDMLNDDMLSHGLFAECVGGTQCTHPTTPERLEIVLTQLLESGDVEVGSTRLSTPDYVEFIAWIGSVNARVERAMDAVRSAVGHDKEFAYWLCKRNNVDYFEQERGGVAPVDSLWGE